MCNEAFGIDSNRVTKNNVIRGNTFRPNLDGSTNCPTCTYDNFVVEYEQENNLFEDNDFLGAVERFGAGHRRRRAVNSGCPGRPGFGSDYSP